MLKDRGYRYCQCQVPSFYRFLKYANSEREERMTVLRKKRGRWKSSLLPCYWYRKGDDIQIIIIICISSPLPCYKHRKRDDIQIIYKCLNCRKRRRDLDQMKNYKLGNHYNNSSPSTSIYVV